MPAYIIARVECNRWDRYCEYTKATPAAIEHFGGRFIVRGGEMVTLEGPEETRRVVVIEFPSLEKQKNSSSPRNIRWLKIESGRSHGTVHRD